MPGRYIILFLIALAIIFAVFKNTPLTPPGGNDHNPSLPYRIRLNGLILETALETADDIADSRDLVQNYNRTSAPPYQLCHTGVDLNKWQLVWHDEFIDAEIDQNKWNVMDFAAEANNELQYYAPDEVFIQDGVLIIRSRDREYKGRKYTSGALSTKNKFDLLYGKVVIKAKLPKGKGIFPAFWLIPADGSNLPEIDIMEMLGHLPNEIWSVCHWEDAEGKAQKIYQTHKGPDFTEAFHQFSLEWDGKNLTWLIDGEIIFSTSAYIPNKPLYLIMNTAIGGDWPGSPDASTIFPQFLEIKYVRVYKPLF